jgi:carbon monoxide dehydrogenase subunit G
MHDVQHLSVTIARRPAEVYEFASDPTNMPRWAAGVARSQMRKDGDAWVADAPFGQVRVRFAEPNSFGVMDHDVTLASASPSTMPCGSCPTERAASSCSR